MTSGDIGTATTPIDNFIIRGGTVTNLASLYTTNFSAAGSQTFSGGLTISNNGSLDMRDSAGNNLTLGSGMTFAGASSLYYELSNNPAAGNDRVISSGPLAVNGNALIYLSPLNGSFTDGSYRLIDYTTRTGTGTFSVANNTRNITAIDETTPGQVNLNITNVAAKNLIWSAGMAGNWDLKSSFNWNSNVDQYYDLDNVTFGDNSGATYIHALQHRLAQFSSRTQSRLANYRCTP